MLEELEAPSASRDTFRMNIDDLLRIATERKASDLHLKVGNYPHLRVDGELSPLTDQPRITAEDMLNMAFSMMSARQKQKFKETTEIDMAYGVAGLGRFRVNVFQQRGNVGLVLRVSDEVQPGVALVPGQRPDDEAVSGTINMLCSDRYTDIGEGATYQSTYLDVAAWGA